MEVLHSGAAASYCGVSHPSTCQIRTDPLFDPEVQLWVHLQGEHTETPPG